MDERTNQYRPVARPLTQVEQNAVNTVVVATGVLAVIGFINSFARVAEAVEPTFGRLAWTVPLGIDLGILIFSLLGIVLARLDMTLPWLRLVPWTLTGATIYLNVADEASWLGRVAHGVLPGLWIVAVAVAEHTIRRRVGLTSVTRMDRIRRSRWLLALPSTAVLWRRMVLWEVTSYRTALDRERDRLLALADLQERYGKRWKKKASPRELALYRLGELTPEGTREGTTEGSEDTLEGSPRAEGAVEGSEGALGGQGEGTEGGTEGSTEDTEGASEGTEGRTEGSVPDSSQPDEELLRDLRAWTLVLDGPPTSRAVRTRYGIGDKRARRLLDDINGSTGGTK